MGTPAFRPCGCHGQRHAAAHSRSLGFTPTTAATALHPCRRHPVWPSMPSQLRHCTVIETPGSVVDDARDRHRRRHTSPPMVALSVAVRVAPTIERSRIHPRRLRARPGRPFPHQPRSGAWTVTEPGGAARERSWCRCCAAACNDEIAQMGHISSCAHAAAHHGRALHSC